MGEVIGKLREFIVEKFANMMLFLNSVIDDIYSLTSTIERRCDELFTPESFELFLRNIPTGRIGKSKSVVPVIDFREEPLFKRYICKVGIADKGLNVYIMRARYGTWPFLRLVIYDKWVSDGVRLEVIREDRGFYGVILYPLLILYKFTTLGDNDRYINVLKSYGLYDIIRYASDVDYVVRYPILNEAYELFGESVDRVKLSRITGLTIAIGSRMRGEGKGLTIKGERRIGLSKVWRGKDFEIVWRVPPGGTSFKISNITRITVAEFIRAIDESIFGITYYIVVMQRFAKYMGLM